MKLSAFDLGRVKALHHLLEEAHVGRAAAHLGITAAAASNALRRLREDMGDPLLVKRGRGLVRTRVGEQLRDPARDVIVAAGALLSAAKPFEASTFEGDLPIALAEHVAAMLLPGLDRLVREQAPHATLLVAAIPLDISEWLKTSGGVLIGPSGPFAATSDGDTLATEDFYEDRYVCVMREAHALAGKRLSLGTYAGQEHILVVPRGLTAKSGIDVRLEEEGLRRRVVRVVPSFQLALPIILQSDLILAMPERSFDQLRSGGLIKMEMPLELPPLAMKFIVHPAHRQDDRTRYIKRLLTEALIEADGDT